jgi:hypothetical protein
MRFRALLIVVYALLGTTLAWQAGAAEIGCDIIYHGHYKESLAKSHWPSGFRPKDGMCQWGFVVGRIVPGDYQKVLVLYRENYRLLDRFILQSEGGDVAEAIKIGRLFRKYLTSVGAPLRLVDKSGSQSDEFLLMGSETNGVLHHELRGCRGPQCVCASACALIWFGAVERNGAVGLHRPRIDDPEFTSLPAADAMRAYRRALDGIARYLDEMEAPHRAIEAMTTTDSAEITWVDSISDDLGRAPSFAEWVDTSCGKFSAEETAALVKLDFSNVPLSRNDELLRRDLSDKSYKHSTCQSNLITTEVDKLNAP